ncbi:MAG: WG repeat-containing protein [Flavobacterium sp.]|uniref:WG repeat-containing protein n=1 Tax=Flavobacterium sp. TaxID=239 RepID=UPI0025C2C367|nr:WG repeat-containing protein [Flavobacterium sp.]MCA1965610.1 WG repeat-containing protein [Flavobacterium sp.]
MTLRFKISVLLFFFALSLTAQENIFPYREGNLWGLCDENAKVLVAPKYDAIKKDRTKGTTFFEASLENSSGVYIGSKNVIPVEFQKLQYVSTNLIIAVKKGVDKKEINYLYNTKGELLINQPLSYLKGIKGNDKRYDTTFIIGFYIKDLEGRESLVNLDYYNDNKLSYVLKDVFSIELDNKKSKEELAIAYVKQTATSAVETKYFKVEGSQIILLDNKKDSQYIQENTGPKKKKEGYNNYEDNIAVPNIDSEMVVEEPRGYSGTGSGSGDGPGRGKSNRKTPKGTSYYKYALKDNQIEVEVSNNVTKNKKTVKLPVKADKIEVFKTIGVITEDKPDSDSIQTYFNYIIYQKKNKFGLVYQFPFQKSVEYDFLEPMKSEKKYDSGSKNYFKVGMLDKKTKIMKYGVIDVNHTFILPAEYDEIKMGYTITSSFKEQVFLVKKNNLFGLVSEKKEIKLPIEFDSIEFNPENQGFLRVKKGNQHSAYISYYSNSDYILTLLPMYYPYPVREIKYSISSGKKGISLLEAIEYIALEDENKNFKGYANPNGTLYFKD